MTDPAGSETPSLASAVVAGLLTAVLVLAMVNLGLWQLRRHADVRDQNAAIESRSSIAVPLRDVDMTDPAAVDFQRVTARGLWRTDEEVLWRGRGRNGVTGFEVLTPFELVDGDGAGTGMALLVDRGWVDIDHDEPPVVDGPVPSGIVEITGILRPSIDQPSFGPKDPSEGRLARVFHADIARLDGQVEARLLPMYLRLVSASPSGPDDVVRPLAAIAADAGPHRGYALQWFSFSLTAIVAWAAWLRSKVLMPRRRRTVPN